MIRCPECGSADVYFQSPITIRHNGNGKWSFDEEEVEYLLRHRDNSFDRLICNTCGKVFAKYEEDKDLEVIKIV